jgi:hypothetical protein
LALARKTGVGSGVDLTVAGDRWRGALPIAASRLNPPDDGDSGDCATHFDEELRRSIWCSGDFGFGGGSFGGRP